MVNFRHSFFGKKKEEPTVQASSGVASGHRPPRPRVRTPPPPANPVALRQTPAQIREALGVQRRPRPSTIAGTPTGFLTEFPPDPVRNIIMPLGYLEGVERDIARRQAQRALEGSIVGHARQTNAGEPGTNNHDVARAYQIPSQDASAAGCRSFGGSNTIPGGRGALERPVNQQAFTHMSSADTRHGHHGSLNTLLPTTVSDQTAGGIPNYRNTPTVNRHPPSPNSATPSHRGTSTSQTSRPIYIAGYPHVPLTTALLDGATHQPRLSQRPRQGTDYSSPLSGSHHTSISRETYRAITAPEEMRPLSSVVTSASLFSNGTGLPAVYGHSPAVTPVPGSSLSMIHHGQLVAAGRPVTTTAAYAWNQMQNSPSPPQGPTPERTQVTEQVATPRTPRWSNHSRHRHGSNITSNSSVPLREHPYECPGNGGNPGNLYNPSSLRSPGGTVTSPSGIVGTPARSNSLLASHHSGEVQVVLGPVGPAPVTPRQPIRVHQVESVNLNPFVAPITRADPGVLTLVHMRDDRWVDGADDTDPDDVGDVYSVGVSPCAQLGSAIDLEVNARAATAVTSSAELQVAVAENESHTVKDGIVVAEIDVRANTKVPGPCDRGGGDPQLLSTAMAVSSTSGILRGTSFVREVTGGPRRGSSGIPPAGTLARSANNSPKKSRSAANPHRKSGVPSLRSPLRQKTAKFALGSTIKSITSAWVNGSQKNAKKRLSMMESRNSVMITNPGTGHATSGAEEALALAEMGYIAPLGSNMFETDIQQGEVPCTGNIPTAGARAGEKMKVSRLKKLKSLASFSNLAAVFKQGDSVKATEERPSRNIVISEPISTTGNPGMVEQAYRVRQQMLDAMGGFEGVSLASSRYAGTMPGTRLGQGAIRVDPQEDCGKGVQRVEGDGLSEKPAYVEEQDTGESPGTDLRSRMPKKVPEPHSAATAVGNATPAESPHTTDPHEGRGYEGIWSGPGIAVNTLEGGIRVFDAPMNPAQEESPSLDPHPGVRFVIPENAPEPMPPTLGPIVRGRPRSRHTASPVRQGLQSPQIHVSPSTESDPFGFERGFERAHGTEAARRRPATSPRAYPRDDDIPVREKAPVWNLLRKANSRFFGRNQAESKVPQQPDSMISSTAPGRSTDANLQTPKYNDPSVACGASLRSMTGESTNTKLPVSYAAPVTPPMVLPRLPVVPMSISSSSESQRFPDSVQGTPLVLGTSGAGGASSQSADMEQTLRNNKPGNISTTSNVSQSGGSDGNVVDEAIVGSQQSEQTDSNWSDTESETTDIAEPAQHYRKESSSDTDNAHAPPRGNRYAVSSPPMHAEPQATPAPCTPPHRRLTADRAAYAKRMLAVRKIETEQKQRQGPGGEAQQAPRKGKGRELHNKVSRGPRVGENLRPPRTSGVCPVPSTAQPYYGLQQGIDPFVLGLAEDPFYDADLEDAMQTASRQLALDRLHRAEDTMFANTRNQLLTAFNNSSNLGTPALRSLQSPGTPVSQAQTPLDATRFIPGRAGAYQVPPGHSWDAQRGGVAQQGLANAQYYRPPQNRMEQEMVARRVRENRFRTENHRRILAGQPPLMSIEEQERFAPRSGPSPPPAFRARSDTTGEVFLRGVTPTLTRNRMERIAVSPPETPTPMGAGGFGRVSLVDDDDE